MITGPNPIDHLVTTISSFFEIDDSIKDFIRENSKIKKLGKNDLIMPIEGLYFISSGLARGYYLENGIEITSFFVKENDFIFTNKQFANEKNTSDALEILETSYLVQISLANMGKLFDDFPITNKVGRIIAEKYLADYRQRINALRFLKAEERFRRFVDDFPEFYFRVPQKYIASFLGIAPETISRILQKKTE